MKKIYDSSKKIIFSKKEIIDFHITINEMQDFFHQPLNFDNLEKINDFYKTTYKSICYYRNLFISHMSHSENPSIKNKFVVITDKDTIAKSCSCFNLAFFIMSDDNYRNNISDFYNYHDYFVWKGLYFNKFSNWMDEEIEDMIYDI